jgi:murein DD-endopeptidase MepM/ murein hydrolase activator NlpD
MGLLLRSYWLLAIVGLLPISSVLVPLPAQESIRCGERIEVRVSAQKPTQGSVVVVEVRSAMSMTELKGGWAGQTLRFWSSENSEGVYRALLGVDLERSAATFPLTMAATLSGGERIGCSLHLGVQDGQFLLEELEVPRRFVKLRPKDLERVRVESQRLQELFARVTPDRLWQGSFRLPVEGIEARGNFGRRRIMNQQPRAPHSGEDFSAPPGTPVLASERGRVALAQDLFFSGKTVILDHGLGLYTLYAHLESIAVEEGILVEAGALVGRSGATGRVTGAHLHWAARLNRARVNPVDLIKLGFE